MAWFVHLYTASGVVFALLAVLETDIKRAFVWLTIAVLIDATDGPMARRFEVRRLLPQIDGRKIDDLVDYLTFAFVPLVIVVKMNWVPDPAIAYVAPALIASLFGFANTGAKDESAGFFLGFPSYWNIVAFYAGIAAQVFGPWPNAIALLILAVLTVTPIGFIYPNLAPRHWKIAILGGAFAWAVLVAAMLPRYPNPPAWMTILSAVYPVFYIAVSMYEYAKHKQRRTTTT
ncbi:MAG: CDP-alcohol phosphatidyltransferase family protein [Thermoanaerobaculia bacterium]